MPTHGHGRMRRHRPVADDVAKRLTSDLYGYMGSKVFDVATVVDMYEWIREGNVPTADLHDLALVAHAWDEHRK